MTRQIDTPRPNIFVVGDAKCGTTSLYRMIQLADGIETSRTRKEQHFFSAPELMQKIAGPGDGRIPNDIVHDEATYLAEFAHVPPQVRNIADVSPSYLQNPPAAVRIRDFAPEARIVIMLRDPPAKIFSQYVHLWSDGREALPFPEAFEKSAERRAAGYSTMFDYEAGGYYADAVARYLELFGRDRVRVEIFEELFGPDPAPRRALAAFLGTRFPDGLPPKMNAGGKAKEGSFLGALLDNDALRNRIKPLFPLSVRTRLGQALRSVVKTEKPVIDPAMQEKLRRKYAPDTHRLEEIIGRPTGWPTAS
jgi:Sulfotransferase family